MTSRSRWIGNSQWMIKANALPLTELVAHDAARLAANSGIELQMSASAPQRPPVFEPHLIHFNSLQQPADDFVYPPDPDGPRTPRFGSTTGQCRTNRHDYDLLVRTVLLAIKHHLNDDTAIMAHGRPDEPQWHDAFDLYRRTFPERKVPSLDGWPPEIEKHLKELAELRRRREEQAAANPQPCSICEAAIARSEGRTPAFELEQSNRPMPTFLIHHQQRQRQQQQQTTSPGSRDGSEQATH